MDDKEKRIRARAEQLWVEEGRPDGRADIHWEMATELLAVEDGQQATLQRMGDDAVPEVTAPEQNPATPSKLKEPKRPASRQKKPD